MQEKGREKRKEPKNKKKVEEISTMSADEVARRMSRDPRKKSKMASAQKVTKQRGVLKPQVSRQGAAGVNLHASSQYSGHPSSRYDDDICLSFRDCLILLVL